MRLALILLCLITLCLAGCGVPGMPMPPSLGLPKPVSDLKAVRKGDTVTLTWTAPKETTDGELIRKPGKMIVARDAFTSAPAQTVSELPLEPALSENRKEARADQMVARDSLSAVLHPAPPADFVVYTVTAQNNLGKTAGPGNQAVVPMVRTMPAPQKLQASLGPRGVTLTWEEPWPALGESHLSADHVFRVMRRKEGEGGTAVAAGQLQPGVGAASFLDSAMEWEKHYDYWVNVVTVWQGQGKRGEVEGEDSASVAVFVHDTFPPAVPSGLQAVFSGVGQKPFIDLTWTPNTDADLAGYNLYRHAEGAPPVKLNAELLNTPSSRDAGVHPGAKYFYAVTAVDLRGNESAKSEDAAETVPKESN